MKRLLYAFVLFSTFYVSCKDRLESRIERIVQPYQGAIDFVIGLDPARAVNDHDIFIFFNKHGLYKKQDVKKIHHAVRIAKRLMQSKKSLPQVQAKLTVLLHDLEQVVQFVSHYATTYAALITYYEITAYYYYIDEQHAQVVDFLMEQSSKIGLPTMRKRGLYKFVKKIDLDLRRLTALFTQEIISDDLVVKMNQTKMKLLALKHTIITCPEYKKQQSKTRWLKAFGVLIVPMIFASPVVCLPAFCSHSVTTAYVLKYYLIDYAAMYALVSFGITMQELRESNRYNIPVHSNSLFSWFTPTFWPLTWIERG